MAIFMPPIFVFNHYLDYIRHKSSRQESNTVVLRMKAVSGHGHFRLVITEVTQHMDVVDMAIMLRQKPIWLFDMKNPPPMLHLWQYSRGIAVI